jgi:hypothetical protein
VFGPKYVDARILYTFLPSVVDKPVTEEHVELARGLFQSIEVSSF